jgi:hypothetical protein
MFEGAADDGRPTRIFAGGINDEEYELWAATEGRKFIRMSEARACSGLGQDEVSHAAHSRSNSIRFLKFHPPRLTLPAPELRGLSVVVVYF